MNQPTSEASQFIEGNENYTAQGNGSKVAQGNESKVVQGNNNHVDHGNSISDNNCEQNGNLGIGNMNGCEIKDEAKVASSLYEGSNNKAEINPSMVNNVSCHIYLHEEVEETVQLDSRQQVRDKDCCVTQDDSVTFSVVGSVENIDAKKLQSILRQLKILSKDASIVVDDIELGSIKFILSGSQEGLERLEALFRAGELSEIEGLPIENVQFLETQTFRESEKVQATEPKKLAFTIAGNVSQADIEKLKSMVTELDEKEEKHLQDGKLKALALTAQRYPSHSQERQQATSQLVREISNSGRLSRPRWDQFTESYNEIYEVALQKLMLHICQRIETYKPENEPVMRWVNFLLERQFFNEAVAEVLDNKTAQLSLSLHEETGIPIAPELSSSLSELIKQVIEEDVDGLFAAQSVQGHPQANFRALFKRRIVEKQSWEHISTELGVKVSTLSDFYQRCLRQLASEIKRKLPAAQIEKRQYSSTVVSDDVQSDIINLGGIQGSVSTKIEQNEINVLTTNKSINQRGNFGIAQMSGGTILGEGIVSELGEGIVSEEIKPYRQGRVRFRGTWWNARCDEELTLAPGTPVRIVKKENITLFVAPLSNSENEKGLNFQSHPEQHDKSLDA